MFLTYDKKGGILLEGGVDYGRVKYRCLKGGVYSGREGILGRGIF